MTAFLGEYAHAIRAAAKARNCKENQGLGALAINAPARLDARNNAKIPPKSANVREKSGKHPTAGGAAMADTAENAPAGRADAFQGLANDLDHRNIAPHRCGTQARILDFKPFEKNTLRAFFSLELASGLILRGCTLHTKNGKFWVGLPAKPYTTAPARKAGPPLSISVTSRQPPGSRKWLPPPPLNPSSACGVQHERIYQQENRRARIN
jgi:hypothetical protein